MFMNSVLSMIGNPSKGHDYVMNERCLELGSPLLIVPFNFSYPKKPRLLRFSRANQCKMLSLKGLKCGSLSRSLRVQRVACDGLGVRGYACGRGLLYFVADGHIFRHTFGTQVRCSRFKTLHPKL
jgi:hypothetical protein